MHAQDPMMREPPPEGEGRDVRNPLPAMFRSMVRSRDGGPLTEAQFPPNLSPDGHSVTGRDYMQREVRARIALHAERPATQDQPAREIERTDGVAQWLGPTQPLGGAAWVVDPAGSTM